MIETEVQHYILHKTKKNQAVSLNDQVMRNLNGGRQGGGVSSNMPGEGRILQCIIGDMMVIDPHRTNEFIKYWKQDLGVPRNRTSFEGFDDYLDFRVVDSASLCDPTPFIGRMYAANHFDRLLTGLATWGMGLTIPSEEKDECWRLTRPVWLAAALTNDVQSWEKKVELVHTTNKVNMTNGVYILMKQDSIDVEEAKHRVLQRVRIFVAEFVNTVKSIHSRQDLSYDSRVFVESAQYMVSGNLVWVISSPRYNANQALNELQAARMKHGWPVHVAPITGTMNGGLLPNGKDIPLAKVVSKTIIDDCHPPITANCHSAMAGIFLDQELAPLSPSVRSHQCLSAVIGN
jgi:hypothetical protein